MITHFLLFARKGTLSQQRVFEKRCNSVFDCAFRSYESQQRNSWWGAPSSYNALPWTINFLSKPDVCSSCRPNFTLSFHFTRHKINMFFYQWKMTTYIRSPVPVRMVILSDLFFWMKVQKKMGFTRLGFLSIPWRLSPDFF